MQIVDDITVHHASYWADFHESGIVTFVAPADMPDCAPCQAVVTRDEDGTQVVRVPWKPDRTDLLHLISGGTVWVSLWGALPPHMIEVQAP